MIHVLKNRKVLTTLLAIGSIATSASAAQGITLKVEVENLAPEGGVYITPVWVGFHDGSFDSYDGGLSSQPGLERIAEDGDVSLISADFLADQTYIQVDPVTEERTSATVDATTMFPGTRVDGILNTGPIGPGGSGMNMFEVSDDGSNDFFSYVSMILPSNDYYTANGNPTAWDISSLLNGDVSSIDFSIGTAETITDAGTEVNDFETSAGNVFFPGLPTGQTGQDQGADENGVNVNVANPFATFANTPDGFEEDFANLDFNNTDLYPNGIARITISTVDVTPPGSMPSVPESSTTLGLMLMGGSFLLGKVWQNHHKTSGLK